MHSVLFSSVTFETLPRLNSIRMSASAFYVFSIFCLQLALHYDILTYSVKNSVKTVIKSWVYFVTYH